MSVSLCLIMMAKVPVAGRVKTRMCPPLSAEDAANLQLACIDDVLRRPWSSAAKIASFAGPEHPVRAVAAALGWQLHEQRGDSLGERLIDALGVCTPERSPCFIGTDAPHLDVGIEQALVTALAAHDVAIVPAFDGGYVAIASRQRYPEIFVGIDWGSERVLAQTIASAEREGLSVALLPWSYDIDEVADLRRLRLDFGVLSGRNHVYDARTTRALLDSFSERGLL